MANDTPRPAARRYLIPREIVTATEVLPGLAPRQALLIAAGGVVGLLAQWIVALALGLVHAPMVLSAIARFFTAAVPVAAGWGATRPLFGGAVSLLDHAQAMRVWSRRQRVYIYMHGGGVERG